MKAIKLVAEPRVEKGSGPMGRLRRKGTVPGVVYGNGKGEQLVQLNAHDFEQSMRGHAGEHMLIDLEIGKDKVLKVLLKEVQHDPVYGKIIHADFNEISMTKKLRVGVLVKLTGEAAGVLQQEGVLEHILREIEVECLPADIPDHVALDVSALHIGERLTVADIKLDAAKYSVITGADQVVAAVSMQRAEEEVAPTVEAATGEPEVITEKKEGEEGEEGAEKADGKKEGKGEAAKDAKGGDAKKEGGKPAAKPAGKPEAKKEEGKKGK